MHACTPVCACILDNIYARLCCGICEYTVLGFTCMFNCAWVGHGNTILITCIWSFDCVWIVRQNRHLIGFELGMYLGIQLFVNWA